MAKLENWAMIGNIGDSNSYAAPEDIYYHLVGNVYNHPKPKHYDGKRIITTKIVSLDKDGLIVTRSGTKYTLGQPDTSYEEKFPNAKDRMIKVINGLKDK